MLTPPAPSLFPRAAGSDAYGREMWARCEALTTGLAGELAEQLRLILEPTTASRLAGDYRTGKRINMKKVSGLACLYVSTRVLKGVCVLN